MAYLQDLLTTQDQQIVIQNNNNQEMGLRDGQAFTSFFPTWEVTAPQYQVPTAWSLSQLGYKTNEVAYACISGIKCEVEKLAFKILVPSASVNP